MYTRLSKPLLSKSFFLFGPRGTGKTSLLQQLLPPSSHTLWFDLLDSVLYREIITRPQSFLDKIPKSFGANSWIVIDEVQRVSDLLNLVHKLIEERKIKFALTGSSARKLKRGGANLLAGRALLNHLHPLLSHEMENDFNLDTALNWGSLPSIVQTANTTERTEFLYSYVATYLREEIKEEQIVRNLDPFARFLDVAAQHNGKILNFSKIARDAMTDSKSVQRYFDILVETFIGFYLEPFHRSIRKIQTAKSKFYFFDIGVKRALDRQLSTQLSRGSYAYGESFEHFFILECLRLNDYLRSRLNFYYIRTKDDVEIDLILEFSKKEIWAIEIKSAEKIDPVKIKSKKTLMQDLGAKRFIFACNTPTPLNVDGVEILPWQKVLTEIFGTLSSQ